jgi:hypothetical protein
MGAGIGMVAQDIEPGAANSVRNFDGFRGNIFPIRTLVLIAYIVCGGKLFACWSKKIRTNRAGPVAVPFWVRH